MRTEEYTPEFIIAALESTGGILAAAAMKLRITRQTLYNYCQRHPQIQEARARIKEDNCDLAETKLLTSIKDGNLTATIFYLKTQGKERGYIEGRELSGPGGGPIQVTPTIDASKLSLDEQKALRQMILKARVDDAQGGD